MTRRGSSRSSSRTLHSEESCSLVRHCGTQLFGQQIVQSASKAGGEAVHGACHAAAHGATQLGRPAAVRVVPMAVAFQGACAPRKAKAEADLMAGTRSRANRAQGRLRVRKDAFGLAVSLSCRVFSQVDMPVDDLASCLTQSHHSDTSVLEPGHFSSHA